MYTNKRKPISELEKLYPNVDFSQLKIREDSGKAFKIDFPDGIELDDSFAVRIWNFKKFLLWRPEKKIAVVSHGGFLTHFLDLGYEWVEVSMNGVSGKVPQYRMGIKHVTPFKCTLHEDYTIQLHDTV